MLDDVVHLLRGLGARGMVQKKNVDVAVGIELAAAKAANGNESDLRGLVHVRAQMRLPRAFPEVPQHDADDVRPFAAEFAAALAILVLEPEPVLLEL